VPTWLTVLAPILAALVIGSPGIAGALLGGRTARRAAERTASQAVGAELLDRLAVVN